MAHHGGKVLHLPASRSMTAALQVSVLICMARCAWVLKLMSMKTSTYTDDPRLARANDISAQPASRALEVYMYALLLYNTVQ